jgi:hypothetical protein
MDWSGLSRFEPINEQHSCTLVLDNSTLYRVIVGTDNDCRVIAVQFLNSDC